MKGTLIKLLIAVTILAGLSPRARAATGDVNVGMMTWYSYWKPVWRNYRADSGDVAFDLEPGFITGPLVSTQIDGTTSISAVFLYWRYSTSDNLDLGSSSYEFERDVHKTESDITVTKRLSPAFRWFFGIKYQGYFYSETETFTSGTVRLPVDRNVSFHNLGPGVGMGLTHRIFGNVFFLPTAGLITLGGYERMEEVNFTYCLGANLTLNLNWYFPSLGASLVVGGRFQHLQYLYHGNDRYDTSGFWDRSDQLYGITAAFIVTL